MDNKDKAILAVCGGVAAYGIGKILYRKYSNNVLSVENEKNPTLKSMSWKNACMGSTMTDRAVSHMAVYGLVTPLVLYGAGRLLPSYCRRFPSYS